MSRRKDNYENSRWLKFKRWVDGEIDPLAEGMETRAPEAEAAQEPGQEPASVQPPVSYTHLTLPTNSLV